MSMSKWWRKLQQALPKPSTMKKTASKNLSFLESKYRGVTKDSSRKNIAPPFKSWEVKTQARELAEGTASKLKKRVVDSSSAIPSKAAEVAREAARGAAAAGYSATKAATAAGAQSVRDARERATGSFWSAMPQVESFATWAGRRIAFLLLGTAFVYGVGSALPGAVARYFTEKNRRRIEEGRGGGSPGGESFSSTTRGEQDVGDVVKDVPSTRL